MTFRLRITLLVAAAVALTAIIAAALIYDVVQRQLETEVDSTLVATAQSARLGVVRGGAVLHLSGRRDILGQIVDASGRVVGWDQDAAPEPALVTPAVRSVAAGQMSFTFDDVVVGGTRNRVYAVPLGTGRALELARPLAEIDAAFADARYALLALALGAALLAAILGALIARAILAPVRGLTTTVEEVTRTRDLSRRVAASGEDELARLAQSFDVMLAALEKSVRAQRQLVADASHELRTPLTSLRTNLELLARGQPTDEGERRELLADLVGQMERLSTLVADLIDLARDEEVALPVEDVPLQEVVQSAVDDVQSRYPRVRFQLEARPTSVRGVRTRIARAVTNLLDNAAKWSPSGGVVEVSVVDGEVSVRDHGPGVAPEDAPRVFDRFWRSSAARHLPGSGLGLSIVKDVAESHGGSVTLETPSDGGARFRLRLGHAAA